MLPKVASVIFVDEAFFQAQMEIAELDLAWVVIKGESAWFPETVGFATNEEVVEMVIGPTEGNLKGGVQICNGADPSAPGGDAKSAG